jgi:hypothetical protein
LVFFPPFGMLYLEKSGNPAAHFYSFHLENENDFRQFQTVCCCGIWSV